MKTSTLTICTFLFFALTLSLKVVAQNANAEWKLLHEEKGVQFFGMEANCSNEAEALPNHFALLKIVNLNTEAVRVNYSLALEFVEGCSGCNQDSEFGQVIDIPAQSSVEGSCADQHSALVRIIQNRNLPGGWIYQSMKIANLLID